MRDGSTAPVRWGRARMALFTFSGTALPGTPFDVDTPVTPIRLKRGEPAEW